MSHNSTLQVGPEASFVIEGDIILSATSYLTLTPSNNISVSGCATLSGNLRVILDSSTSISGSFNAMDYSCRNGTFTRVESATVHSCESSSATVHYSQTQVQVSYTIDRSNCHNDFDYTIVYIIVAVVGALILVTVILMFAVKPIRQRIMPYRDREMFMISSGH